MTATGAYWRLGAVELDRWLQQRIDRFYRRMAVDLGAAALVWLAALCLILIIARRITRPMRELATVAERVHHGEDYNLRARERAGGEIGSLIDGFNAMLDRLQSEAAREQERVSADRAAEAQRQCARGDSDHHLGGARSGWPDPLFEYRRDLSGLAACPSP